MTKKELLEALKDYPEDAEVYFATPLKFLKVKAESFNPDDGAIYLANDLMDLP